MTRRTLRRPPLAGALQKRYETSATEYHQSDAMLTACRGAMGDQANSPLKQMAPRTLRRLPNMLRRTRTARSPTKLHSLAMALRCHRLDWTVCSEPRRTFSSTYPLLAWLTWTPCASFRSQTVGTIAWSAFQRTVPYTPVLL